MLSPDVVEVRCNPFSDAFNLVAGVVIHRNGVEKGSALLDVCSPLFGAAFNVGWVCRGSWDGNGPFENSMVAAMTSLVVDDEPLR